MYAERLSLKGRVAVVTGGGRGIGLACCEALAEGGARVVIATAQEETARAGQAEMKAKGYDSDIAIVDVTDSAAVTACADEIVARLGKVDILVANAGISRAGTAAEDVPDALFLDVNDVNYNGVFWCNRAFGRHMLAARRGSIVNIGSISAAIVNRPQHQSYYNASKAAMHHLTRCLAVEWADRGVRVNAVAPTYIDTPMLKFARETPGLVEAWINETPMGRLGDPVEVASVVQFLASDAASLLTGSIIFADGGYTCW